MALMRGSMSCFRSAPSWARACCAIDGSAWASRSDSSTSPWELRRCDRNRARAYRRGPQDFPKTAAQARYHAIEPDMGAGDHPRPDGARLHLPTAVVHVLSHKVPAHKVAIRLERACAGHHRTGRGEVRGGPRSSTPIRAVSSPRSSLPMRSSPRLQALDGQALNLDRQCARPAPMAQHKARAGLPGGLTQRCAARADYLGKCSAHRAHSSLDRATSRVAHRVVRSSQAPPPWTTLHRWQAARNPFKNRRTLFRQGGPLLKLLGHRFALASHGRPANAESEPVAVTR